jgi:hypothetical protein
MLKPILYNANQPSIPYYISTPKTRDGAAESPECLPILPRPETKVSTRRSLKVETRGVGPRTLFPGEEKAFESRFSTIWKGMVAFEIKPEWEITIPTLRSDVWFSRISSHIPLGIKRILLSPYPPTPAELRSLA